MSLVVSLRIPDGIVVAADSLATSQTMLELVTEGAHVECPHCHKKIGAEGIRLPPLPIPFSASSYTQKLFPVRKKFALSTFGLGVINKRTTYYHLHRFERFNSDGSDLKETIDSLIAYFEEQLLEQFPRYREEAPEEWHPLGFHIDGFENIEEEPTAVTYEVYIGRKNTVRRRDQIGCTVGGDIKVIQKLWEIGKEEERLSFKYHLFSLQDAIDFCEFLVSTASVFQRFANEVPTIGGEIDIALLTPFHAFQWIRRKELMKRLAESDEGKEKKDSGVYGGETQSR